MAYNFYDLGIKGNEVKRRLELLKDIGSDNGVASQNELNEVINDVKTLNDGKANIIQNNVYGQNIKIDDILKENTPMSVRVSSKNLIPFPYFESNLEYIRDGLTFTICSSTESAAKMKGQIGIRGTLNSDVTETSYIIFDNNGNSSNNLQLSGPVTFSCEFQYTNNACKVEVTTIKLNGKSVIETITQDKTYIVFEDVKFISKIRLIVNNTATLETAIVRPQLEIGRFSTTYAPYINDFNGIKLYKVNENLLHLNSNEEKVIVGNGSSITSSTAFYKLPPVLASSGTFKISVHFKKLELSDNTLSQGSVALQLRRTNGKVGMKTVYGSGDEGNIELIYTLDATYNSGFEILLYGNVSAASRNTYCEFSEIKVTVSDNDVDFSDNVEPQIETEEYTFTGSNVITGIPASYPTTSFYTNSFSALLEVQYYADLKKYIDNNYSRLPTSQIIDAGRITDYI